jgi:SOS-response transcriptional repressor LexA
MITPFVIVVNKNMNYGVKMNNILDRIRIIITTIEISDTQFAKSLEIPQATLSNMFLRKSEPRSDLLEKIVKIYNISPNWLLTGSGEMFLDSAAAVPSPAQEKIPLLRQTVSCGPGQSWGDADNIEAYIEPISIVPAPKGAEIYAFRVRGTSMVGAGIYDGDIILFNGSSSQDLQDDLYVFALDGNVYCKLVKFDQISRRIQIYSVQTPDLAKAELIKTLDGGSDEAVRTFHIFGRVLAWLHENRIVSR